MTDTDIVTKLNREADEQVLPKHGVTTYAAFLMHEAKRRGWDCFKEAK